MKNKYIQTLLYNYNPKNYQDEFNYHKVKNVCVLIDEDLNEKQIKKIGNILSKFINDNYYKNKIHILCHDENIINKIIININKKTFNIKNKIIVNTSRKTIFSQISKLKERKINNVLIFTASYNKGIVEKYCNLIDYKYLRINVINSSIRKNIVNSYTNSKIVSKL